MADWSDFKKQAADNWMGFYTGFTSVLSTEVLFADSTASGKVPSQAKRNLYVFAANTAFTYAAAQGIEFAVEYMGKIDLLDDDAEWQGRLCIAAAMLIIHALMSAALAKTSNILKSSVETGKELPSFIKKFLNHTDVSLIAVAMVAIGKMDIDSDTFRVDVSFAIGLLAISLLASFLLLRRELVQNTHNTSVNLWGVYAARYIFIGIVALAFVGIGAAIGDLKDWGLLPDLDVGEDPSDSKDTAPSAEDRGLSTSVESFLASDGGKRTLQATAGLVGFTVAGGMWLHSSSAAAKAESANGSVSSSPVPK